METLEQRGVVSAPNHTGKREILINSNMNSPERAEKKKLKFIFLFKNF